MVFHGDSIDMTPPRNDSVTLTFEPTTLKMWLFIGKSVENIRVTVSFVPNPSMVHQVYGSQDFYGRRWVALALTLTDDYENVISHIGLVMSNCY